MKGDRNAALLAQFGPQHWEKRCKRSSPICQIRWQLDCALTTMKHLSGGPSGQKLRGALRYWQPILGVRSNPVMDCCMKSVVGDNWVDLLDTLSSNPCSYYHNVAISP